MIQNSIKESSFSINLHVTEPHAWDRSSLMVNLQLLVRELNGKKTIPNWGNL